MKRPDEANVDQPPLLRLILFLGKPFGIAFVPQHYVQVVYRMGKYAGCRGPGLIYYGRLTETLGPLVLVKGQRNEYTFENIVSRDVLPVTMHVATSVAYDPAAAPDLASTLTRVPRETYVSIGGTYIRWALMAAANRFNATELTQADVRAQIENAVHEQTNNELKFLGLRLSAKLRLMSVELPAVLTERQETIAQRRASIMAGAEFHPAEYRRALVSEVLERLSQGNAESFVNFGQVLEAYAAEHPPEGARPANPLRIVEQTPLALPDRSRTEVEQPQQETEEKPPARPKSRL
jgi:SPFH domain/Band 7 family protein